LERPRPPHPRARPRGLTVKPAIYEMVEGAVHAAVFTRRFAGRPLQINAGAAPLGAAAQAHAQQNLPGEGDTLRESPAVQRLVINGPTLDEVRPAVEYLWSRADANRRKMRARTDAAEPARSLANGRR